LRVNWRKEEREDLFESKMEERRMIHLLESKPEGRRMKRPI
jgi:hypothetical protein